jgi:uncharacterized protein (TIGR02246 family)
MRSKSLLRLACLAFVAFGTPSNIAPTYADQGNNAVDRTAIQTTIDANNTAVGRKDMDAILSTFTADAVMVGPGGTVAAGQSQLRLAFEQFLAISPTVKVNKSSVVQAGDVALYSYSWTVSGKTPDGHPIQQSGLTTAVLRKQADGRWLMVIDDPFTDQLLKN